MGWREREREREIVGERGIDRDTERREKAKDLQYKDRD